jgi:prepilin-type N-terminal cleavage/methylation domain-containing protein
MKNLGRVGGFTLVELILALFVGALLMSAIYVTMISGQKSSAGVERKVAAQQDVRAALEIMAMEIGMASYNPFLATGIWVQGPTGDCTTPGNQTYKGIQEATPTAITVEMDIGPAPDFVSVGLGDGAIGYNALNPNKAATPPEIVRYSYIYDGTNKYITRTTNTLTAVGCDPAQPFLGGNPATAPAGTKTVTVKNSSMGINNGAGDAAVFRYYDSNGIELYPGTDPTKIPNIRRVDITLGVETEERDPSTNQFRQMVYSTSVLVRNHAIN